ncbi:hypothetical protein QBC33DRAFT_541164 [Phialemonium atrogriseum]|uniref:Uncharacterized protein n=1 Tax=Phialemonium atrogriseum TaxID=1093897 RepID=A0AAJ0BXU1_9PEZI|nr:uncharacterized protein QBC33DRAFT_541164 [Phialemonium atrogriseum]KAK1766475.1 hypothetical protein QBC33DRAFT_541164 [Phialemonium atrogriseum]
MGSNTTYEYTAITAPRTIRLMAVHPGSGTDPVHLRLVTTALDAPPGFRVHLVLLGQCAGPAPGDLQWHILSDPILERSHNRLLQWVEGCYRLAFGHGLGSGAPVSRSVSPEFTMAFSRTMVCGIDSMRNRLSPELICEFPRYIQWAIDCAAADRDADMGQQHPVTKPSFSTTVDETVWH